MAHKFLQQVQKFESLGKNKRMNFVPIHINGVKLLFMKMGRSAGTLIYKQHLVEAIKEYPSNSIDYRQGGPHWVNRITDEEILNDYTVFIVTRNPFERVVSYYESLLKFGNYGGSQKYTFSKFINEQLLDKSGQLKLYPDNGHLLPISTHFELDDGTKFVDHIIRFENLEEDWDNFCSKIKLNLGSLTNESQTVYQPYYDSRTRTIVGDFYKRDLELFNYSFN